MPLGTPGWIWSWSNLFKQKTMRETLITQEKFVEVTGLVIDNLEGGYYHPDMKKSFNEKSQKAFGDSGETMFGIDRKHGIQLAKYDEWKLFWQEVDKCRLLYGMLWKYNYRGGVAADKLKELCAKLMYQWFSYLASKYLKPESIQAIANDDRLLIHFSYASWNGEGWFQKYAKALQSAAVSTPGNKAAIYSQAIKARTESSNAVIRQQGVNMLNLFAKHHL